MAIKIIKLNVMKKIISYLLFILGICLIITCFNYFTPIEIEHKVLVLNTVITSFIYSLFFIDVLIPMVDFSDESHAKIGSLGVRWLVTLLYALLAIGLMLVFAFVWRVNGETQIILHSVLILLALLGLYGAVVSSNKVGEIYQVEQQSLSQLNEIKEMAESLVDEVQSGFVNAPEVKGEILEFRDNLRFISPCNNDEAFAIERAMREELSRLEKLVMLNPNTPEEILLSLNKCNSLYKKRKSIYSN